MNVYEYIRSRMGCPTEYVNEPLPANSRILVSRNKREGGYLGRYRSVFDNVDAPRRRHHRKGSSFWPTLRHPERGYYGLTGRGEGA